MIISDIFSQGSPQENTKGNLGKAPTTGNRGLVLVYAVFISVAVLIFHGIAEGEFSAFLTLSVIFQCLGISLLGVHVLSTGGVHGISAKSLQLEAIALACRLSGTTWLEGYLPSDPTGEFLYQVFDGVSLGMVLMLLCHVLKTQRKAQADDDALPVTPFALGSLVLAALLHADLDDRPIFDTLWMTGLFAGAVAVVPQLWLMTRNRGNAPAMTSHFVAVMAFSRLLSLIYFYHAYPEVTSEPWFETPGVAAVEDPRHAGHAIVAGHVVHLMLLGDFAYHYVKNVAARGLHSPLELPQTFIV